MILYGKTKKKELVIDNVIEVVINIDKNIITFSKAAMEHFGIKDGYIGISEDEGTIVSGVPHRKAFFYKSDDKGGFKVFQNGNVNSKFYVRLLKDIFFRGSDTTQFKLDVSVIPTVIPTIPDMQFYEFLPSTESLVSDKTQQEVAKMLETFQTPTSECVTDTPELAQGPVTDVTDLIIAMANANPTITE